MQSFGTFLSRKTIRSLIIYRPVFRLFPSANTDLVAASNIPVWGNPKACWRKVTELLMPKLTAV